MRMEGGRMKAVGVLGDLLVNIERTELASVELRRGSCRLDVASKKPYFIASLEVRVWKSFLVRPVDVLFVCFGN